MKNLLSKKIECIDVRRGNYEKGYLKEIVVEHCLDGDPEEIYMYVHNGNDDDDIFISLNKCQAEKLIKVLNKIVNKRQ